MSKRITDVMRMGYTGMDAAVAMKLAEKEKKYGKMPPEKLAKLIAKVEKEMRQAAQNLEFELAAQKRDELRQLRNDALTARDSPAV